MSISNYPYIQTFIRVVNRGEICKCLLIIDWSTIYVRHLLRNFETYTSFLRNIGPSNKFGLHVFGVFLEIGSCLRT